LSGESCAELLGKTNENGKAKKPWKNLGAALNHPRWGKHPPGLKSKKEPFLKFGIIHPGINDLGALKN